MLLQENVPLKNLTTMRLGGPADFVLDVFSENDCVDAFAFAEEKGLPFFFLGLGANAIAPDSGFPGVIIRNRLTSLDFIEESPTALVLRVGGGFLWDDLVALVVKKGYTGCEALSGIPSTVAAAPVQNIGAYGQELKNSLLSLEVFDTLLSEFTEIDAADCDFSYRHSIFNSGSTRGRYFILSCTFRFPRGEIEGPLYASLASYLAEHNISSRSPETIRSAVLSIRSSKLPDPEIIPSAGSFFKNLYLSTPEEISRAKSLNIPFRDMPDGTKKVNTAWLLAEAGLPGKNFFGFELLPSAPLVLVNRSAQNALASLKTAPNPASASLDKIKTSSNPAPEATTADLERAKSKINDTIFKKFGFRLAQEPDYIKEYPL